MEDTITEKLALLKCYIREEGGIIDLNWCGDLLYPYYKHFNDSNPSHMSGSLIAFWGLLIEWDIKEAKRGFSIDRIATGNIIANEIDLLIKLMAYNLYERFKHDCCEPVHQGYTITRFRLEFFHCAATIIQHSRQVILKLAIDFANRYAWQRMATKVTALE